jgi:hypothetical protein
MNAESLRELGISDDGFPNGCSDEDDSNSTTKKRWKKEDRYE